MFFLGVLTLTPPEPLRVQVGFETWNLSGSETPAWKYLRERSCGLSTLSSSSLRPGLLSGQWAWKRASLLLSQSLLSECRAPPSRWPHWPWPTLLCLPSDLGCTKTKIRKERESPARSDVAMRRWLNKDPWPPAYGYNPSRHQLKSSGEKPHWNKCVVLPVVDSSHL